MSDTTTAAPALQASTLGMQDFLNILLTQLTYQDPLKPMDNQAFIAQMAQFTTLGQTQQLNNTIDALLSTQASMQAIGLIGRTVEFSTGQDRQSGTVTALSWSGNVPLLTVRTAAGPVEGVSLSQVLRIQ